MDHCNDGDDDIWKSDEGISQWISTADERERTRVGHRRLMADLLPFGYEDQFTILDLGAGTGAAARAVLDRYPKAQAILSDYSLQMISEAHRELSDYKDRYTYVELDLASGNWRSEIPFDLGAVISSLCVHHLPHERKGLLFREIFAHLEPGGWYLNYDPVIAQDPEVQAAWLRAMDRRDPAAAEKRANRSPEEQRRYESHIRHMMPLAPQIELLGAAGFEAIDVFLKELDHVIYGGRRPMVGGPAV